MHVCGGVGTYSERVSYFCSNPTSASPTGAPSTGSPKTQAPVRRPWKIILMLSSAVAPNFCGFQSTSPVTLSPSEKVPTSSPLTVFSPTIPFIYTNNHAQVGSSRHQHHTITIFSIIWSAASQAGSQAPYKSSSLLNWPTGSFSCGNYAFSDDNGM